MLAKKSAARLQPALISEYLLGVHTHMQECKRTQEERNKQSAPEEVKNNPAKNNPAAMPCLMHTRCRCVWLPRSHWEDGQGCPCPHPHWPRQQNLKLAGQCARLRFPSSSYQRFHSASLHCIQWVRTSIEAEPQRCRTYPNATVEGKEPHLCLLTMFSALWKCTMQENEK